MKWLIWFLSVLILLLIEGGVFTEFHFLPVVPVFLVVFCSIVIAMESQLESAIVVLISGILMDFTSGLPDGILLLSLGLSSFFAYVIMHWLIHRDYNLSILFAASGVTTLLFTVAVLGFTKAFDLMGLSVDMEYGYIITRKVLWYIVINLILTYPVYLYYLGIRNLVQRTQKLT